MKIYKRYMCLIEGDWQVRSYPTRRCIPFKLPEGYTTHMALRLLKHLGYLMRENVSCWAAEPDWRWVMTTKGFKAMIEKGA